MRAFCYLAFVFALCFAFDQQSFSQTVQADQRELIQSQAPSPFGPNASPGGVEGGQAVPTPNDSDLGEQQILNPVATSQLLYVLAGKGTITQGSHEISTTWRAHALRRHQIQDRRTHYG